MKSTTLAAPAAATRRRSTTAYRWARQLHLWVGAWGALAAVLFGSTGLVMNHRFGDGAWPQGEARESARLVLDVPAGAGNTPESLRAWLAATHHLDAQQVRTGKPKEGRLGGRQVAEAPKWNLSGGTARGSWQAEYVPGNRSIEVKQSRHTPLAALLRLHKGVGGGWAWSLLVDSFAVGMVLLGLSGLWMWARGRSAREMVVSVMGLSTAVLAVVLALALA